jgi:hypothetical protein
VQKSVVEAFPNAPVSMAIVWIDMLPWDGERAAKKSAKILSADRRIRQFHDPEQRVGDVLAKELGWSKTAWDIYLFYPKDAEWRGKPPAPSAYAHQIGQHARDGLLQRRGSGSRASQDDGHDGRASRARPDEDAQAEVRSCLRNLLTRTHSRSKLWSRV